MSIRGHADHASQAERTARQTAQADRRAVKAIRNPNWNVPQPIGSKASRTARNLSGAAREAATRGQVARAAREAGRAAKIDPAGRTRRQARAKVAMLDIARAGRKTRQSDANSNRWATTQTN